MARTEIIMNCTNTGKLNEQGEAQYVFNYVVNAEPGHELFSMLCDFLHQAPDWVAENVALAVKFHQEHDRENCPHCQQAELTQRVVTFEEWKAELIKVTARALGISERGVKLNDEECLNWFASGATPWQTFRENYNNDGD
jgi:hypothetical protein